MLLASLFKDKIDFKHILEKRYKSYPSNDNNTWFNLQTAKLEYGNYSYYDNIVTVYRRQRIVASISIGGRSRRFWNFNYTAKLLHGYQMDRITVWLNPGSDAQGKRIQYHSIFNCFRLRAASAVLVTEALFKTCMLPSRNVILTLFLQLSRKKFGFFRMLVCFRAFCSTCS